MKPIKNIILYSSKLPPKYIGGIETNAYYMIRMLQEHDSYKLFVATQGKPKFYRKHQQLGKGKNSSKAFLIEKKQTRNKESVMKLFSRSGFDPENTLIYHNTLDLHPHYQSLKSAGFRQVARSGGNDIFYHSRSSKEDRAEFIKNLNLLDRLILNSGYSLQRSVSAGLDKERLVVIKGGCEKGGESSAHRSEPELLDLDVPSIISCGRLVDFKGLEDAIDAMKLVREAGFKFKFYLIGDGALLPDLKKRVERYGLEDCCIFLGKQPPERIPDFYRNATIYLSSSKDVVKEIDGYTYTHTETMGRSICEAQIHGVPVVSTDAGGAPEMLRDGETGLVIPQGNVKAMAEAIIKLLTSQELIDAYAANAFKFASEAFSWSKVFSETCKVFRGLDSGSQL